MYFKESAREIVCMKNFHGPSRKEKQNIVIYTLFLLVDI